MRGAFLAAAVYLSLFLQVEAAKTSNKYWHEITCPFPTDMSGNLTMQELPTIVGVPITDKHFNDYSLQLLCKAMCFKPRTTLVNNEGIADMVQLNANFRCQNDQVKFDGNNSNEILTSWNLQVQKPKCEVVHNTVVCVVDTFQKQLYTSMHISNCAIQYHFYVLHSTETFGDLQCNLKNNEDVTIVDNFFDCELCANVNANGNKNIFFAPEADATKVVAYYELQHAMPAAQNNDEYKQMLGTWQELCGEDTAYNTSTMCKSVTGNMLKACKSLRTSEDDEEIQRIETCLQQQYLKLERDKIRAKFNLFLCELTSWEIPLKMQECLNLRTSQGTSRSFDDSFGTSMANAVNAVCEFLCCAYNNVCFVWSSFVSAFWYIGIHFLPAILFAEKSKNLMYFGIFGRIFLWIIQYSNECQGGYQNCNSRMHYMKRTVYFGCFGPVYLVNSLFMSAIRSMFGYMGFCGTEVTEIKHEIGEVRESINQIGRGHGGDLDEYLKQMEANHLTMKSTLAQLQHQYERHGMNSSMDSNSMGVRRGRSHEDAKRDRGYTPPPQRGRLAW